GPDGGLCDTLHGKQRLAELESTSPDRAIGAVVADLSSTVEGRHRWWGRLRETNPTTGTVRLTPWAGGSSFAGSGRPSCRAPRPARRRCGNGCRSTRARR